MNESPKNPSVAGRKPKAPLIADILLRHARAIQGNRLQFGDLDPAIHFKFRDRYRASAEKSVTPLPALKYQTVLSTQTLVALMDHNDSSWWDKYGTWDWKPNKVAIGKGFTGPIPVARRYKDNPQPDGPVIRVRPSGPQYSMGASLEAQRIALRAVLPAAQDDTTGPSNS